MKWYQKPWATVLLLFLFFPVGLYLMWKHQPWKKSVKIIISAILILFFIPSVLTPLQPAEKNTLPASASSAPSVASSVPTSSAPSASSQPSAPKSSSSAALAQLPQPNEPKATATLGEKNALKTANDYLNYTAFSYTGLISQLEYEGYTKQEATYAVKNCDADWDEQAAKCAKSYMEYSSFSKSGLIEQLEYEGFTKSQAEYGAKAVGY